MMDPVCYVGMLEHTCDQHRKGEKWSMLALPVAGWTSLSWELASPGWSPRALC
jgi:hypothetical protein